MRIAIWTGAYQHWDRVHPNNLWRPDAPQMGGSEATALSMAWQLAKNGHDVLLAAKAPSVESFLSGRLRLVPLDWGIVTMLSERYDAIVTWDDVSVYRYNFEHIPVHLAAFQLNHILPVHTLDYVIDRYLHPSQWHADRYVEEFGVPPEKQVVGLTNGIAAELSGSDPLPHRQPHVLWCSSPDRGLDHLLRFWPQVRAQIPKAELHIYYDMDRWLSQITGALQQGQTYPTTDRALAIQHYMGQLTSGNHGVSYHGGVSRVEVFAAMLAGSVLAYPCDPVAPTECFSMVMLESIVAGLNVVCSDADAFPELWGWRDGVTMLPLPIADDSWVDALVKGLKNPYEGTRPVPETLTYRYLADHWVGLIEEARG